LHDSCLYRGYSRFIEPWLLALHYINSPAGMTALTRLTEQFAADRYLDDRLQQSFRSFTVRELNHDLEKLQFELEDPASRGHALAILGTEFHPVFARNLVSQFASRSTRRQEAEIELFLAWLRRHPQARRVLLPLLEELVTSDDCRVDIRWRLACNLRRRGHSQVRMNREFLLWLSWSITPLGYTWRLLMGLVTVPLRMLWWLGPFPLRRIALRGLAAIGQSWMLSPGPGVLGQIADSLTDAGMAEAEFLLQAAVSRYPDHSGLLARYASFLSGCERYSEAADAYRRALSCQRSPWLLQALAQNLQLAGRLDEAVTAARQATEVEPRESRNWSLLGETLLASGLLDEAERVLKDASARFPRVLEFPCSLGDLLVNCERYAAAGEAYGAALNIDPDHADLLWNQAECLKWAGQLREAATAAWRAMLLEPDNNRWQALVSALPDDDVRDLAEWTLERVRVRDNPGFHYCRAVLLSRCERYSEAADEFRAALLVQPDSAELLRHLALNLIQAERTDGAASAASRAVSLAPDDVQNWVALIYSLITEGSIATAEQVLQRAFEQFGKHPVLCWWQGILLQQSRRYREAADALETALAAFPDNTVLRENLEECRRRANESHSRRRSGRKRK
ncbi:MAG: tetratricopeptide repeat protein, partial [Planctomycetaceae bacterium]|nr:tetratricopeptide repeat protein [Planctomycetaceae bacterium]